MSATAANAARPELVDQGHPRPVDRGKPVPEPTRADIELFLSRGGGRARRRGRLPFRSSAAGESARAAPAKSVTPERGRKMSQRGDTPLAFVAALPARLSGGAAAFPPSEQSPRAFSLVRG